MTKLSKEKENIEDIFLDDMDFLINNGLHSSLLSIEKLYDYILTKNKNCTIYEFVQDNYERLEFIDPQFTVFNSKFITITYTWNSNIKELITSLIIFSKKVNINYLWMDAFCINQMDDKEKNIGLNALEYVYNNATYHLCINLRSLERMWCQYELSIRQRTRPNSTMFIFSEKDKILMKDIYELVKEYNFSFINSKATFEKDKEYINNKIKTHFKSVDEYDIQLKRNYIGAIHRYKELNKKN